MIRSPSSASATNKARSRSGGMISASTGSVAVASTKRRPPANLRQFADELAGPVRNDASCGGRT